MIDSQKYVKMLNEELSILQNSKSYKQWHDGIADGLVSIFNQISIFDIEKPTAHYFEHCFLNVIQNVNNFKFPTENAKMNIIERKEHLSKLENEINGLGNNVHPNTFLSVLRKYLWCVPSEQNTEVSVYEYLRLKIAKKSCNTAPNYLLVCGDITGIQSYIYGVAHSGAMKALKGRSFWLNQTVESLAYHVIEAFGLTDANLIYSSGGKFYALLPSGSENKLKNIKKDLQDRLLKMYDGDLGIAFGWAAVSDTDLDGAGVSAKWTEVNHALENDKRHKFAELLRGNNFFDAQGNSGQIVQCQFTKKELCTLDALEHGQSILLTDVEQHFKVFEKKIDVGNDDLYELKEPKGRVVSKEQYFSQLMGRRIKSKNNYWKNRDVVVATKPSNLNVDFSTLNDLERFDFYHHLEKTPSSFYDINRATLWNDTDLSCISKIGNNVSKTWKFYGGNWRLDKTFEDLIPQTTGLERLGVLRLDVDNLGYIFRKGLGNQANFGRIVQLSLFLDFFFSGYINRLKSSWWCVDQGITDTPQYLNMDANKHAIENLIEIVYSGGDDIFIVGVWNVLPDVAIWLNDKFTEFTGGNKSITLSAGIALFEEKFPLFKAAQRAGEAEDTAKSKRLTRNGIETEKNAICFLDVPMSWADFTTMQAYTRQWYNWIEIGKTDSYGNNKKLNQSFISRLLLIYSEFKGLLDHLNREKAPNAYQKALFSQWRWHACYSLHRYAEQNRTFETDIKKFATELFITPQDIEQDWIALLYVPATWVDFLTRKNGN